jgi:hypothetical protein
MSVSCECCVLSDRGLRVELITGPECGLSMWVWSWIIDNEAALAHWGLLRHEGKKLFWNRGTWRRKPILPPKRSVLNCNTYGGKSRWSHRVQMSCTIVRIL